MDVPGEQVGGGVVAQGIDVGDPARGERGEAGGDELLVEAGRASAGHPDAEEIPAGKADRERLEDEVGEDLSLPHREREARIHVPMLSGAQGPGFSTLLGLGLTALRILDGWMDRRQRRPLTRPSP